MSGWWLWVKVIAGLGVWFFVGGFAGVLIGANPYITAYVAMGGFVLYMTYRIARHQQLKEDDSGE